MSNALVSPQSGTLAMGQTVTIACSSSCNLGWFEPFLEGLVGVEEAHFSKFDDQLQLVASDRRWSLVVYPYDDTAAAAEEYASNEDLEERFRRDALRCRFFAIRFDDVDVIRRLLRALTEDAVSRGATCWIDTDYGWVIDGRDFLRRTEDEPRWDWRHAGTTTLT